MKEEKIKIQNNWIINGPPDDKRCVRCGKHVDELTPFDLADENGIDHAFGKKLVKNFREVYLVDYNENCEMIIQYLSNGSDIESLYQVYGEVKVKSAITYESMRGNLEVSWECKDCLKEEGPFKHYINNQ